MNAPQSSKQCVSDELLAAIIERCKMPQTRLLLVELQERRAAETKAGRVFHVVERFEDGKSAGYWDGGNSRSFISDIDKAVQFCRKQDAFWATRGWHWNDTKITEHIMLGSSVKTSSPQEKP